MQQPPRGGAGTTRRLLVVEGLSLALLVGRRGLFFSPARWRRRSCVVVRKRKWELTIILGPEGKEAGRLAAYHRIDVRHPVGAP